MMEEVVRLSANDYEQAIDFLDLVFSQLSRPHHFERALPRMCRPDDEHMGKHLAVKVNGRIVSMLGVYPLPVVIDGERFMFSTTGNVATHHRYEGRGYAHRLLNCAMEELDRIGADASRLDGFRQRYNRFGYEIAGSVYRMNIYDVNVRAVRTKPVRFEPVQAADSEIIEKIQKIQTSEPFYADRGSLQDFYLAAIAWENRPYAAYDENGSLIGCLCVSPDGQSAAELIARDGECAEAMAAQWIKGGHSAALSVTLPPWNTDGIARISRFSQTLSVECPSRFKIIRWAGIANALCRIQSRLMKLPDGEFTLAIEEGPTLRFLAERGTACCEETDKAPDITLDRLTATRFLFGPQAPWTAAQAPVPLAGALMPLPLSWCGQDRV